VGGSQKRVLCSQLVEIEWEEDVQAKAKGFSLLIAGVLLALFVSAREQAPSAKSEGTPEEEPVRSAKTAPTVPKFLESGNAGCQEAANSPRENAEDQVNSLNQKEFLAAVQASDDPAEWNAPEAFAAVYMKMLPHDERRRRLARLGAGPKWSEARIEAVDIYNAAIRLQLGTRRRILAAREGDKQFRRALRREFPEVAALIVRSAREELTNQGGGVQADYLAGGSYSCVFDLSSLPRTIDVRRVEFVGHIILGPTWKTQVYDATVREVWMTFPFSGLKKLTFDRHSNHPVSVVGWGRGGVRLGRGERRQPRGQPGWRLVGDHRRAKRVERRVLRAMAHPRLRLLVIPVRARRAASSRLNREDRPRPPALACRPPPRRERPPRLRRGFSASPGSIAPTSCLHRYRR